MSKILYLPIKKKWFDMILSGEKKEEYRDIKSYYTSRFNKSFDIVEFRNGYGKNVPSFQIELLDIDIGLSQLKWCDVEYYCYILRLGKIIKAEHDCVCLDVAGMLNFTYVGQPISWCQACGGTGKMKKKQEKNK